MLDQIQAKIDRKLYEMSLVDVADLDPVTITTGTPRNPHNITLISGTVQNGVIEGKDAEGHNIHLPVKYIIDIN